MLISTFVDEMMMTPFFLFLSSNYKQGHVDRVESNVGLIQSTDLQSIPSRATLSHGLVWLSNGLI